MKQLNQNKRAVELTLQTIVIFILLLITLIVMIYFFTTHYGNSSETMMGVGSDAIKNAKNFN